MADSEPGGLTSVLSCWALGIDFVDSYTPLPIQHYVGVPYKGIFPYHERPRF